MRGAVPPPLAYGIRNAVHEAKMIFIDTTAGGNAPPRDPPDCKPACKSPYIFRSSFSSYQISFPIGDYLSAKGTKDWFLAYANYGFGTESKADFTTGLKKNGGRRTSRGAPPPHHKGIAPLVAQETNHATKNDDTFFTCTDPQRVLDN